MEPDLGRPQCGRHIGYCHRKAAHLDSSALDRFTVSCFPGASSAPRQAVTRAVAIIDGDCNAQFFGIDLGCPDFAEKPLSVATNAGHSSCSPRTCDGIEVITGCFLFPS